MPADQGEYRPIFTRLVDGASFQELKAHARAVFYPLKLKLGPLGIAAVPTLIPWLEYATALSADHVKAGLRNLEAKGWIEHEKAVVWLVRGLEFEVGLKPNNPPHLTHVQRLTESLPNLPIVTRFRARYPEWFAGNGAHPGEGADDGDGEGATQGATRGPSRGPRGGRVGTRQDKTRQNNTSNSVPAADAASGGRAPADAEGDAAPARGTALTPTRRAVLRVSGTDLPTALTRLAQEPLRVQEQREYWASVIFAYWAHALRHPDARLDDRRLNLLIKRLREWQDDPSPLLFAVFGATKDDWITGRDQHSTKRYDRVQTIFRDFEQTERLAELGGYTPGARHPLAVKYGPQDDTPSPQPEA